MGLFDSNSSSSTTNFMTDNRVTGTEGSNNISGTGNAITVTDAGAIENSFDFASDAMGSFENMFSGLLDSSTKNNEAILSSVSENTASLLNMTKSESERSLETVYPYIIGGVSLIAIVMLMKGLK